MAAQYVRQAIIFCSCGFFLSFFFSPRLFSAIGDWMSTILPHMMSLSANLECMSEMCCTWLAENTGRKNYIKPPSAHHRTTLSGYIFATKAYIDNRQKLLNSNISSTCPARVVQWLCHLCAMCSRA